MVDTEDDCLTCPDWNNKDARFIAEIAELIVIPLLRNEFLNSLPFRKLMIVLKPLELISPEAASSIAISFVSVCVKDKSFSNWTAEFISESLPNKFDF